MSLRGRYLIDRIKRAVGTQNFRLPVPPYGDGDYWDKSYRSFSPEDSLEWGDLSLHDFIEYDHKRLDHYYHGNGNTNTTTMTPIKTTLAETMGIIPNATKDEPILMLGCGNSRMGEDMIQYGWRGPIIQVDISTRVVESMSQRCGPLIQNGDMNFIQDDATELSAFRPNMIQSCLDKGLIDALFCADEYDQCQRVLKSVHRVLKPGGTFLIWSFSQPDFLLPRILDTSSIKHTRNMWDEIQIHELPKILLYKFQKKYEKEHRQIVPGR